MFRSTFTGINTATTGLNIAQRQLDVTAHNISNANVTGYSRQRYITRAEPPKGWNSQLAYPERGKPGGGVATMSLDQIRDLFLDRQFRNEQTKATYWETRSQSMYYIEDVFNSIGANSLDGVLAAFFSSLQELSKNSTDEAVRTNVVSQAKKLADVFHMYDQQLTDLMEQQNFQLREKVKHTNQILDQIATLNDNIFRFELGGSVANDLRDARANLLDELSSLLDISYEEVPCEPDPIYNIYGIELFHLRIYAGKNEGYGYNPEHLLVQHFDAFHLIMEELDTGENNIYDDLVTDIGDFDPPFVNIYLSFPGGSDYYGYDKDDLIDPDSNGIKLAPYDQGGLEGYYGGLLQSYIDIRDGNTIDKTGIPYYLNLLNHMVECFVEAFNDIHRDGYEMPCQENNFSSSGMIDFFADDGLTARTIRLSDDILATAFNIAASSNPVSREDLEHYQTGNNEIILRLIMEMKESIIPGLDNSAEGFYKNFLGLIASEAAEANGRMASQEILLHGIHTQRTAVSSVSEDEEMTNMIRFQHAYNASARTITTIDEMLDKLINGTGRVGLV